MRDGRSSATGMLVRSALVGKHSRESGGVRYAGFRVLRGGEEPRRHGTAVEKQPTAAPAHTVSPLRRRLAALGRSSLRRSSALTVFRMAMRRSNLPDTTPEFLIDPARYSTAGNVIEDTTSRATIVEPRRRDQQRDTRGRRDSACSISIVDRRSGDPSVHGKLIVSPIHDVEKTRRDASSVDACTERFLNRTNITLLDSNKLPRKWRIRNKLTVVPVDCSTEYPLCNLIVVSSKECKRRGNNDIGDISSKLLAGVVKQARSTLDREVDRSIDRNSVDTTLAENSVTYSGDCWRSRHCFSYRSRIERRRDYRTRTPNLLRFARGRTNSHVRSTYRSTTRRSSQCYS